MSEFLAAQFYYEGLSARCPIDYSSFTEEECKLNKRFTKCMRVSLTRFYVGIKFPKGHVLLMSG